MTLRILIVGGFGFVGGRLADHLLRVGHHVVLGSRNAVDPPVWLPQAKITKIDWNDARALERSCGSIDVLIQAAGMNAQDCAADPVGALAFNGVATARLVAAASRVGVKRFIYLSTAHVYASPLVGTISEETCPRNLHPYATSHLAGEHAVLSAGHRAQIESIVLRLSNVIGAPMYKEVNCWMLVVNDLCRQAVETRKMVLHTVGGQQRNFVSMTEVCRIAAHLAFSYRTAMQPCIFNVGGRQSQSVLEMAHLIQHRCTQVLGFEPVLQCAKSAAGERHPLLTYLTDNLAALDINAKGLDNSAEIDSLIRYCQTNFTPLQS